ncbi:tetratricopeptide repeat (TPR)-like superfamily protein [Actinidia rufa]|uniref:Tetratricopeptide repeat (TPR)-like superfamily protein n=1 Tax=Actinidia rufa TaxID=165716 RepID=A0A7J0ELH4_9ERIC|nr:tetratricopeptide repeat (TPR)-like superfamily protein [Actinidia rufa]
MEQDRVAGDLVLYSNLIELSISVSSRLKLSAWMAKEADRLFWSMRKMGIGPSVVSYNMLLWVYGDTGLFGEAIHLFRLMQRKDIEQNVVTCNNMISIYGKTLEHEKVNILIQEMKSRGIEPNAITYSTIISISIKAGKFDLAAMLLQKLWASGIDQVLYQTMIVAYETVGLVGHAKRLLHKLKLPDNIPRETAIRILAKAGRIATMEIRQDFDAGEVKDISVFVFHFQMLSLYGTIGTFDMVESLFERLGSDPNINKKQLHLVVASIYERANRLYDASQIINQMGDNVLSNDDYLRSLNIWLSRKSINLPPKQLHYCQLQIS